MIPARGGTPAKEKKMTKKNKSEVRTKGLRSLGDNLQKKGVKVASSNNYVPDFAPDPLMDDDVSDQYEEAIALRVEQIKLRVEKIGKKLNKLSKDNYMGGEMDDVVNSEKVIATTINAFSKEVYKRQLAEVYVSALVDFVPRDSWGLNHIADQGLAVGFLCETSEDKGIRLPVSTMVDGRPVWRGVYLRTVRSSAQFKRIKVLAEQVQKARDEENRRQEEALLEGATQDLLQTMKTGGECVFYAPSEKGKRNGRDYYYPGGKVRVLFKDGAIHPVDAQGKCWRIVQDAVEHGVYLEVGSLESDRIDLKGVEADVFLTVVKFHGLCRRGYLKVLKSAERTAKLEEMRSQATVSPKDFVLHGAVGVACLYLKFWNDFKNLNFLVERNSAGKIKVVWFPDYLGDLFSKSQEFVNPGENFCGLDSSLGGILRSIYKLLSQAEQRAAAEQAADDNDDDDNGVNSDADVNVDDDCLEEFTATEEAKARAMANLAANATTGE